MPYAGTKEQINEYARRAYHKNRASRIARVKARYEVKKVEILEKARVRYHGRYRDSKLAKIYGITKEEAQIWLAISSCEICGSTSRRLTLDHDHNGPHGVVRGRLCGHCNSGLGHFKDNPDTLEAAARYIRERMEKAS